MSILINTACLLCEVVHDVADEFSLHIWIGQKLLIAAMMRKKSIISNITLMVTHNASTWKCTSSSVPCKINLSHRYVANEENVCTSGGGG